MLFFGFLCISIGENSKKRKKFNKRLKMGLKIIAQETLFQDPFILFKKATYLTKSGEKRDWAYIERNQETKAIVVLPFIKSTKEIVLIKQYRIPVASYVIEFPAGLIDEDEDIVVAGLRELKEETGYSAKPLDEVSPVLSTSAGLGSELIYLLPVQIDETIKPAQALEDSEDIEVLLVSLTQSKTRLKEYAQEGCLIDSKVYAFLGYLNILKNLL
jgi:8-oxo-dGTP pyrophosphatase MutT (NUDIX family)